MYDDFSSEEFKKFIDEFDINEISDKPVDKFPITDKAIKNIPYIKFSGFSDEQCLRIQQLEKMLLNISRLKNNCNEVALTYRLDGENFLNATERISVVYGDENHVNIFSDAKTRELFETSKELAVISMHNHPNNTSYSFSDLIFFYSHDEIRLFIVVTNTGKVSSISREDLYLKRESFGHLVQMLAKKVPNFKELKFDAINISDENKKIAYSVMKKWLKEINQFGLNYEEGVLESEQLRKVRRRKTANNRQVSGRSFTR